MDLAHRASGSQIHLAERSGNLGARLVEIGRTAEEAGFSSLWVMDHFFQIRYVGATEEPSWRATAL